MAQPCTICGHAQRAAIEQALVAKVPNRRIATRFGVSEAAVRRHGRDHLPQVLAAAAGQPTQPCNRRAQPTHAPALAAQVEAMAGADAQRAIDVLAELARCVTRVNKLFEACDAWLTDPDDPARYDIGPRASDVRVIYELLDAEGRAVTRKHGRLSWLIAWVQRTALAHEHPVRIVETETKHADPRTLILETAGRLQSHLQFLLDALATARGVYEQQAFQAAVLEGIGDADHATRARIIAALERRRRLAGDPGAVGGR